MDSTRGKEKSDKNKRKNTLFLGEADFHITAEGEPED